MDMPGHPLRLKTGTGCQEGGGDVAAEWSNHECSWLSVSLFRLSSPSSA